MEVSKYATCPQRALNFPTKDLIMDEPWRSVPLLVTGLS